MGQAGDTPRGDDQGDRLAPGEPGLGDVPRAAVAEVAGEGVAGGDRLAGPDEPVGQMLAADRGAGMGVADRLEVDEQAELSEPIGHRLDPVGAPGAEVIRGADEGRVVVADEVAEQVDFLALALGRQLDPGDQFDAESFGLGAGDGDRREGVMVGDRDGGEADRGG